MERFRLTYVPKKYTTSRPSVSESKNPKKVLRIEMSTYQSPADLVESTRGLVKRSVHDMICDHLHYTFRVLGLGHFVFCTGCWTIHHLVWNGTRDWGRRLLRKQILRVFLYVEKASDSLAGTTILIGSESLLSYISLYFSIILCVTTHNHTRVRALMK